MDADVKNLTTRMPSDLWEWFRDRAKAQSRSANSQLIADLKRMREEESKDAGQVA